MNQEHKISRRKVAMAGSGKPDEPPEAGATLIVNILC
jgi:hypothetical protein